MAISRIQHPDIPEVAQLAHELWPEAPYRELLEDFQSLIASGRDAVFIFRGADGSPLAFQHISLRREHVEGTANQPVGYLEGIYVRPPHRRQGVARKLLKRGEAWAQEMGCREFASDVELDNLASQRFHEKAGFVEVNRVVCFAKKL